MKALTCAAAQPLLNAFHDRELAVMDEIAVAAHIEGCQDCAAIVSDLRVVSLAVRKGATQFRGQVDRDAVGFVPTLVTRMKAEHDASLLARVRLMFDDMHMVYASAGSIVSAMVCLVMMLGMTRFVADNRPDSLGAILSVLAVPAECNTSTDAADGGCRERWAERFQRANESAEQDAVLTLGSVVMRQGHLSSLAVLRSGKHRSAHSQVEEIEGLLDTVSRARLDVPTVGPPRSVVRMMASATVRGTKPQVVDSPLPTAVKKRAAAHRADGSVVNI